MYARSSTVHGKPQNIDEAAAYLRDRVMPAVLGLDGYVGLSMLADRTGGRCIATTSWTSEEAMHDSESPLHQLRARFGEILGGRPQVQEWEIGIVHRVRRAPAGATCRVIWSHGDPDSAERVREGFRTTVLPLMEQVPGFCSLSMFGDQETGRAALAVTYESRDAMDRATAIVGPARDDFTRSMGGQIDEVAEFDLVLAHLRVPETV